jgi:epoxyqueuosine reductase QueG
MKRAGVVRFRRNIAVAMGNTGEPSMAEELEANEQPSARDPLVAEHVAWAAAKLRG